MKTLQIFCILCWNELINIIFLVLVIIFQSRHLGFSRVLALTCSSKKIIICITLVALGPNTVVQSFHKMVKTIMLMAKSFFLDKEFTNAWELNVDVIGWRPLFEHKPRTTNR